ncbi:MAG: CdaR family protein [Acidobacteria bacterium]|nr:CdaR family protein [Acidobacteriota bacterium]
MPSPLRSAGRMLRATLLDQVWLKLFSVLVAVLLWLVFVEAPELTTSVSVPVEFKNFPVGLDTGAEMPDEVQLQISGPRDVLSSAGLTKTAVVLDLANFNRPGERTYTVTDSVYGLPPRVRLVRAIPFQLRLSLEPHVSRNVPVKLRFAGAVPNGFAVAQQVITPATVAISGPKSQVERVEAVQTDPFEFATILEGEEDKDKTLQAHLPVYVGNARVRIDSASAVDVKLQLQRIRD